jgi:hypothetical protein
MGAVWESACNKVLSSGPQPAIAWPEGIAALSLPVPVATAKAHGVYQVRAASAWDPLRQLSISVGSVTTAQHQRGVSYDSSASAWGQLRQLSGVSTGPSARTLGCISDLNYTARGAHQVDPADDSVVGMSYQASEAGLDEGLPSLSLPILLYM